MNWVDPEGLYWEYNQSTGQLTYIDDFNNFRVPTAKGYAGIGDGWNNSHMQYVKDFGPLPEGWYTIGPMKDYVTQDVRKTYKNAMELIPDPETKQTFGKRTGGFFIHGDNDKSNNTASIGCPVFKPNLRTRIDISGDNSLRVVPW